MDIPGFSPWLPTQSLVLVVPIYTQDNCGHPRILPLPSHSIPGPSCPNLHSGQLWTSQDSPPCLPTQSLVLVVPTYTQDNCGHPKILPLASHSILGPSCPNLHSGQLWTSQDSPPAHSIPGPSCPNLHSGQLWTSQDSPPCLPTQSLVLVVPTYTQDNCGHPRILPLPSHSIPGPSCPNLHSGQLWTSQDSPPAFPLNPWS